jgi:hypothetical protein
MTTGVATRGAVDSAWIVRALRSAVHEDVGISDGCVHLATEVGPLTLMVEDRLAIIRLLACVGGGGAVPSTTDARSRAARMQELQDAVKIARVTWHDWDDDPALFAEYELPILAGISRGQFLAVLRMFLVDVALLRSRTA